MTRVAPAAVKGELTLSDLGSIARWKAQLASNVFDGRAGRPEPSVDVTLHAKIGDLALENDFLEGALGKSGLLGAKR